MNYKDIFNRAFSDIGSVYPFSDDQAVFDRVKERAKIMEKNEKTEKNRSYGQVTEVFPPADMPKPRKAPRVIAAVAASAAVIGAGVLGVNFLNEHGGLKEGGSVAVGAGYHEDMPAAVDETVSQETEPAETEAVPAEETLQQEFREPYLEDFENVVDAGGTFRFCDEYSIGNIRYAYDGLVCTVGYDVIYDNGIPEEVLERHGPTVDVWAADDIINNRDMSQSFLFKRWLGEEGNTVHLEMALVNRDGGDFDLVFTTLDTMDSLAPWENGYKMTAKVNPYYAPVVVKELYDSTPAILPDGTQFKPTRMYLSEYFVIFDVDDINGISFSYEHTDGVKPEFSAVSWDGEKIAGNRMLTYMQNKLFPELWKVSPFVGAFFDEPVNTREFVFIELYGQRIAVNYPVDSVMSLVGKQIDFTDVTATLKTLYANEQFITFNFEIAQKDINKDWIPFMNFGEDSLYTDGEPFDDKLYAFGYKFEPDGHGKYDYSFTVCQPGFALASGETLHTALYCAKMGENGLEYEKGPDVTFTGLDEEYRSSVPLRMYYTEHSGQPIKETEHGSVILDDFYISLSGMRLEVTYTDKDGFDPAAIQEGDLLYDTTLMINYRDGETQEFKLADSDIFTDTVNGRRLMFIQADVLDDDYFSFSDMNTYIDSISIGSYVIQP